MTPRPTLIAVLIAAAIGAAGGYALAAKIGAAKTARIEAQLARCGQDREKDARAAAEAAAQLLARAQEAEVQAAGRLAAQRAAFEKRLKEVRSEIYSLSTGRECLSGALRLRLNAAIGHADDMPAPAGDAPADAAAPAADPGRGATDANLAAWILDAASRYEECRARIDALRHWDEVTHGR